MSMRAELAELRLKACRATAAVIVEHATKALEAHTEEERTQILWDVISAFDPKRALGTKGGRT